MEPWPTWDLQLVRTVPDIVDTLGFHTGLAFFEICHLLPRCRSAITMTYIAIGTNGSYDSFILAFPFHALGLVAPTWTSLSNARLQPRLRSDTSSGYGRSRCQKTWCWCYLLWVTLGKLVFLITMMKGAEGLWWPSNGSRQTSLRSSTLRQCRWCRLPLRHTDRGHRVRWVVHW
jgi:hypothetical protein